MNTPLLLYQSRILADSSSNKKGVLEQFIAEIGTSKAVGPFLCDLAASFLSHHAEQRYG